MASGMRVIVFKRFQSETQQGKTFVTVVNLEIFALSSSVVDEVLDFLT